MVPGSTIVDPAGARDVQSGTSSSKNRRVACAWAAQTPPEPEGYSGLVAGVE